MKVEGVIRFDQHASGFCATRITGNNNCAKNTLSPCARSPETFSKQNKYRPTIFNTNISLLAYILTIQSKLDKSIDHNTLDNIRTSLTSANQFDPIFKQVKPVMVQDYNRLYIVSTVAFISVTGHV